MTLTVDPLPRDESPKGQRVNAVFHRLTSPLLTLWGVLSHAPDHPFSSQKQLDESWKVAEEGVRKKYAEFKTSINVLIDEGMEETLAELKKEHYNHRIR